MRRLSLAIAAAALLPVVAMTTLVTAETYDCSKADANNQQVKTTCRGTIKQVWDENKCMWYKCVDDTAQTDLCAEATAQNAVIEKQCRAEGKSLAAYVDQNQCKRLYCVAGSTSSTSKCMETDKRNAEIKQSCPREKIQSKYDQNGCTVLWCSNDAAPVSSVVQTNYCQELKNKLSTLKEGTADYKYVWELWKKSCDPSTVPPMDWCAMTREKLASMDSSTKDYAQMKEQWWKKCGEQQSSSVSSATSTQCTLTGDCWLKCENGVAKNICQCGSEQAGAKAGDKSSPKLIEKVCKRVKDARTGRWTRVCQ